MLNACGYRCIRDQSATGICIGRSWSGRKSNHLPLSLPSVHSTQTQNRPNWTDTLLVADVSKVIWLFETVHISAAGLLSCWVNRQHPYKHCLSISSWQSRLDYIHSGLYGWDLSSLCWTKWFQVSNRQPVSSLVTSIVSLDVSRQHTRFPFFSFSFFLSFFSISLLYATALKQLMYLLPFKWRRSSVRTVRIQW